MDCQSLLADLCSPPGVWVGGGGERREEGVICGHVTHNRAWLNYAMLN